MNHLFFIAVATGIVSGTTLTVKAQSVASAEKFNAAVPVKKSQLFIEGIEINSGPVVTEGKVKLQPGEIKKPVKHTSALKTEVAAIESFSTLQFKYALLLDMDVESIDEHKILFAEIDKWLNTRYRYGGTTEKGIDCSAYTGTLLADVYKLDISRTSRAQYAECEKIEKEDLQQGDLVFFNTRRRGKGISHVGLYLGNGYFTHSGSSSGVTISNLSESYWGKKYINGGRIIPPAL